MDLSGTFKMNEETRKQIKSNHSDTICPQIPEKSMYVVFFKPLESVFRHIQSGFGMTLWLRSGKQLLKAVQEGRKK